MPKTFESLVAELRPGFEAKGLSELREIVSATDARMEAVASAIGPEADIMLADSLPGETASERIEAFGKLHAENAAAKDALVSKQELAAIAARITDSNSGGGLQGNNSEADIQHDSVISGSNPFPIPRGLGDAIFESKDFPGLAAGKGNFDVDIGLREILAATFRTSAGWPPESVRSGRIEYDIQRELDILDFLPVITSTQQIYKFMQEGSITNAAAERNEGAALPEQTLSLTETSVEPRSVGTNIPVTQEQMEDEAGVRQYLNFRLGYLVRRRLEDQLISGNGTAPNIQGLLSNTSINTITRAAAATTNTAQTYYEAQTTCRVQGEVQPDAYLIHPTHWQLVVTQVDTTKQWLFGLPGEPIPGRLWGLPVLLSTGLPQTTTGSGTALANANVAVCGAFRGNAAIIERQGLRIEMTDSHDTDFINLVVRFRAYLRATLAVFKPKAFTQIRGVNYGRTDS